MKVLCATNFDPHWILLWSVYAQVNTFRITARLTLGQSSDLHNEQYELRACIRE